MLDINVRLAQIEDADRIADIHVRSWQSAYRNIIPDSVLTAISVDGRARSWRKQFTEETVRVLVAEVDKQICGWIAFGVARDADTPSAAEVYAIYIEPNYLRRGIGSMLWSEALKLLVADGRDTLVVWLLEANTAARRFYESIGGQMDGNLKLTQLGPVELEEVRYRFPMDLTNRSVDRPISN